ncbi:MAG: hypothetical protein M1821_005940 [Bathelium mastoideum]|nr:MAG: hypothetical protein M1821_005940 [Bathelium mastoideum]
MSGKPYMRWLKVVDTDDPQPNKIVGGAMYELHETNPFADEEGQRPIAYHYPDGAERELVTQLIESGSRWRKERMSRPHIFLQTAWTHPVYQRRGCARLFMQHIVTIATELGLDCWLHATPMAVSLYERYGFHVVEYGQRRAVLPAMGERDREGRLVDEEYQRVWRTLEDQMGPVPLIPMQRPGIPQKSGAPQLNSTY